MDLEGRVKVYGNAVMTSARMVKTYPHRLEAINLITAGWKNVNREAESKKVNEVSSPSGICCKTTKTNGLHSGPAKGLTTKGNKPVQWDIYSNEAYCEAEKDCASLFQLFTESEDIIKGNALERYSGIAFLLIEEERLNWKHMVLAAMVSLQGQNGFRESDHVVLGSTSAYFWEVSCSALCFCSNDIDVHHPQLLMYSIHPQIMLN